MCASLYIDRLISRFRLILPTSTIVIAALTPVQDASAQSDLAAMNQQVIRLYQSEQMTEAIALAEKTVAIAKQRLGADNKAADDRHVGGQLADDIVIGDPQACRKNAKARPDAGLLHNSFAGIAGQVEASVKPAAAAPGRRPDRDAGAACRPAAPPRCAARSAPTPTRGSASYPSTDR